MKKRIFDLASAFFAACLLSVSAFGEALGENLTLNYPSAAWQGDKVFYDDYSSSVYFERNADKDSQTAYFTVDVDENATGFFFYLDAGNGKGSDSGFCTITITDNEGNSLFSSSTGNIKGFSNYSRFSVGDENHYYPIPDGAEKAVITITAAGEGSGRRINMYFRNFNLYFANEKPLLLPDPKDFMDNKAGLSKVEVGITAADHWFWIITVFMVALVFFIIAKWKQRYSTPKVMKSTDRKNRI